MDTVLIVVHLLIAAALVGVILLQKSEGGGLGIGGSGSGGGMSGFMTGRATADLLTRTTSILAVAFMGMSMLLAVLAAQDRADDSSILDVPAAPVQEAPAPVVPSAPIAN